MARDRSTPGHQSRVRSPEASEGGHAEGTRSRTRADAAWRIHDLVSTSVERADTKAWIVVTLEVATAAAIYNLSDPITDPLGRLSGAALLLYRAGILLVCIAALLALLVVFPSLGPRSRLSRWLANDRRSGVADNGQQDVTGGSTTGSRAQPPGFLYFGHLMDWKDTELRDHLAALSEPTEIAAVAHDVQALSRVAWRKYLFLQRSLCVWVLGVTALFLAGLLPT